MYQNVSGIFLSFGMLAIFYNRVTVEKTIEVGTTKKFHAKINLILEEFLYLAHD